MKTRERLRNYDYNDYSLLPKRYWHCKGVVVKVDIVSLVFSLALCSLANVSNRLQQPGATLEREPKRVNLFISAAQGARQDRMSLSW